MRNALTKVAALALALAPAAARAEVRLAYVDLQRALNEVDEGKAATEALKKDFEEKQRLLNAKKTDFDRAQAEFEKQAALMSDAQKRDRGMDLERRARELQDLYAQLQKDFSTREREATRAISEKMAAIVRSIAEAEGITMVLERGSAVVYAPESLDITNDLIRKYNARHPPGAAKKPEGKKPDAAKKPEAAPAASKK